MSKALVTGAAGFIGSHLCERLLRDKFEVRGLDNFDSFYDPSVKHQNLALCKTNPAFELLEGDIRNAGDVDRACQGVDIIVHLAARAGVRPSIESPLLYQDVNVTGTCVLLEAARNQQIRNFIFASSSSVYGNSPKTPFSESDIVDFPISPYAATKKAGELFCHAYHHLFAMNITCLRFFTVYGARQRPDLAIHKFAKLIESGKPIPVFGDGTMMRDHTYIDDIIAGIRLSMDRCSGFHVYNLGESQPISLNDLIAAIESALGKKAVRQPLPPQPGDVDITYANVSRAKADLGYTPSTALAVGLGHFVRWFRRATV